MAEQTTVFQAVDYIVALARTAFPDPSIGIYDGPATGDGAERVQILIAYNDEEGGPAIEGSARTHEFGVPAESYTIDCSISIDDGDIDLKAKRAEVRELFNSLVGAVRADRTLGGLIRPPGLAEISGFVYSQDQGGDGGYVVAAFSVEVREATIWNA